MKTNDYVKYLTQEFVTYVDRPKQERKQSRKAKKTYKKDYSLYMFGLVPFALGMLFKRKK